MAAAESTPAASCLSAPALASSQHTAGHRTLPAAASTRPSVLPAALPSNTVRHTPAVSMKSAHVSCLLGRLLSTNTATMAVTTGREALQARLVSEVAAGQMPAACSTDEQCLAPARLQAQPGSEPRPAAHQQRAVGFLSDTAIRLCRLTAACIAALLHPPRVNTWR